MIPQTGGVCPSIRQVLARRGAGVFLDILRLNHVCRFGITVNFFPYSSQRLTIIGTLFSGAGEVTAESLGFERALASSPLRVAASTVTAVRTFACGRDGKTGDLVGDWGFRGNRGFDSKGRLRQTRSACFHQRASRLALSPDALG